MAKHGIIVTILGKQYELTFEERLPRLPDGRKAAGWCDHPETVGKKIRIRQGMTEEQTLDTLIHEMLHAAAWQIKEELVEEFSSNAAEILCRLGWTKREDS